jgi:hypothetical protein
VAYWLYFWSVTVGGEPADPGAVRSGAEVVAALQEGHVEVLAASENVLHFRRDLIASDPSWTGMILRPRPGAAESQDRYLALGLADVPADDQLRDLRYLAARNRLHMYDPH